ncbi:helix-turn-helix domain-containing protein [Mucilaginibacter celer]|uniref:Helix-turn-helix domain-containing protein n=1 Tax=Mucilaginibacter celer TaxID=2305508 RepID=A0A494VLA8_9SPHI|nr:helix-turn-helix transcriptional regulator [Mucilaginibacter celer]AYL95304.1 helix-turn-helix domain-containing protein [Mucilaginibacter celer]
MTLPIGEKIRLERLAKQYSQEYMAWSLEISQAAYSKVERDETELTIRRIYQIAEILEISPFRLLPKPKYGTAIVGEYFWKMIAKICGLWQNKSQNRTPDGVF